MDVLPFTPVGHDVPIVADEHVAAGEQRPVDDRVIRRVLGQGRNVDVTEWWRPGNADGFELAAKRPRVLGADRRIEGCPSLTNLALVLVEERGEARRDVAGGSLRRKQLDERRSVLLGPLDERIERVSTVELARLRLDGSGARVGEGCADVILGDVRKPLVELGELGCQIVRALEGGEERALGQAHRAGGQLDVGDLIGCDPAADRLLGHVQQRRSLGDGQ